ncbi:hypothetical protein QBC35DRAFT_414418 [Podospora australis]|uniref:Uncharacterized protein n=1 Tax=Podospora australis TaxID=1536484 RepID=A0AAN6WPC8_9PEZI|nr:hypothetical protein QBC35DRAFT_414418 [Podospora australis]
MEEDIFGAGLSDERVSWQREPAARGTFTILATCLMTIILSVWSTYHFNLRISRNLVRFKWILVACIIPELVVLIAAQQYLQAWKLTNEYRKKTTHLKHPWTMTHSFWATMGGIAIDTTDELFIPRSHSHIQKLHLTPYGSSWLLQHEPGIFPDIPAASINAKSSGSRIIKFLAGIQALRFCASCVGRLVQKLPLSQLEIMTVVHIFCTVMIWVFWRHKPFAPDRPTLITDPRIYPLGAFAWMASKTSALLKPSVKDIVVSPAPEFEAIEIKPETTKTKSAGKQQPPPQPEYQDILGPSPHMSAVPAPATTTATPSAAVQAPNHTSEPYIVTPSKPLRDTGFYAKRSSQRWCYTRDECIPHTNNEGSTTVIHRERFPAEFHLFSPDIRRWQLAKQALDTYGFHKPDHDMGLVTLDTRRETILWLPNPSDFLPYIPFMLVSAVSGTLFALAWKANFPNERETKLWRVASLIVAAGPIGYVTAWAVLIFLVFVLFLGGGCRCFVRDSEKRLRLASIKGLGREVGDLVDWLPYVWPSYPNIVLTALAVLVFLAARVFLVWESFRTLGCLAPEAYQVVEWTLYWPRFGQ